MSAFDKVHKGKAHKERSQPRARRHKGLLEKKKDYKLRAKDFNLKKRRIKALKRRAALRNPDEFYFGMQHSHIEVKKRDHHLASCSFPLELSRMRG